jgi:hypothetical protein
MRSSVRFVMHPPNDEANIVTALRSDPNVADRWTALANRNTNRDTKYPSIGGYCIVWSLQDIARLAAEFIPTCNDWYCRTEFATIQFLRSSMIDNKHRSQQASAQGVEKRFKQLSRNVKNYTNKVLQWCNPNVAIALAGPSRSANPSKPDPSLWVGPFALQWLADDAQRRVKQVAAGAAERFFWLPNGSCFG